MHPRNKLRLLAGIAIDPSLEQVTEAREVPNRKDVHPANEKNLKKKLASCEKACAHMKNAVKALEAAPATDTDAKIPQMITDIESLCDEIDAMCVAIAKVKPIKEGKEDKPDYIDADGDGNKKESMKKALKDKDKKKEVKEGSAYPGCENEEESSKPYSKDAKGKVAKKKFPGEEKCDTNKGNKECKDVMEDHFPDGTCLIDPKGKCWEVTGNEGEGDEEVYHLKCPQTKETCSKKYTSIKGWKKGSKEDLKEMSGMENEESYNTAHDFKKGEKVMYDNGIWIVHVADAQADLVGLIPPSMKNASTEEKGKAMQQVKRDKIRKPSEEECEVMAGPDGIMGTADDRMGMRESTHNYAPGNVETHEDEDEDPINVVGQGKGNWANSLNPEYVKNEYTSQLDQRGDQSMDDYVNKVKVPAKVKTALADAIKEFEAEAEKTPMTGHTASEKRQFFMDTAAAFQELHDMLAGGTIMDVKKAQVYASSLMGPMLHKLPDVVWDFVTNGGQKRSLKDYMNKVEKFPIEGPRNTQN